jgi:hypothetical protein
VLWWSEIVIGWLLILALLALSGYYGRQQVQSLRHYRHDGPGGGLPDEEIRYERRKAYRRLVSCILTLVLAVLLATLLTVYEWPAHQLAEQRAGFDRETAPPLAAADTPLLRAWAWTWIAFLVVLMLVVFLAAFDLYSTRRYALRQYRKIQADRRAMIERQANRMRRDRNGHG